MRINACKAVVEKVVPPKIERDPFTQKPYETGNYVCIRECNKQRRLYILINGSINNCPPEARKPGVKGLLVWHSIASGTLPFFQPNKKQ